MTTSQIHLEEKTFHRRIRLFHSHWKNSKKLGTDSLAEVDVILVNVGIPNEATVYQKSTALHFWLFGYEFPETIMVLTMDSVSIITSPKKGAILEGLNAYSDKQVDLKIYRKAKDDSSANVQELFEQVLSAHANKKIGVFAKDKAESPLTTEWNTYAEKIGHYTSIDVSSAIANILVIKDEEEHELIKLASKCSSVILKDYVVDQILTIIDEEKTVTHEQLSEKIEATVMNGSSSTKKTKLKFPSDVDLDHMEMCYPPIVQSGGDYSLRPSAISDSQKLHFGTILCSLGVRYKSYCSNVARSFLIEPNKQQEKDYKFLLELQKTVLGLCKPGTALKDMYDGGLAHVQEHRPDLVPHLVNNVGFSMGLEYRESDYLINGKSSKELSAGMIINLILGFSDIPNTESKSDPRNQKYSLLLSDTIDISKAGPTVLTEGLKKLEDISYFFKDEDEQDKQASTTVESDEELTGGAVMKTRFRHEAKRADAIGMGKKREEHQKDLLQNRIREGLARYADVNPDAKGEKKLLFKDFECYKKDLFIPKETKDLNIFVDRKNECVLFPMYGMAVPFHISTIKNVSKSDEGVFVYLRVNFNCPGRTVGKKEDVNLPTDDPRASFVRALTYRSSDTLHMNGVFRDITDLRKAHSLKEAERKESVDLVTQESLSELRGRRPVRLPDVYVRPAMEGKRVPGDLEIHTNGLRYRNMIKGDQKLDVLFSNIKHCFFQPCDNEMIALVHFHLHHPILIGKKKTKDVQFYREASDAIVDDTGTRRRRMTVYGDEDEIMQEQEERRQRASLNLEFKEFCEKLTETHDGMIVDLPIRELGFFGVPFRQNVLVQPTRECLVHLTDPPFLVVPLVEVEVVSLERVLFNLKNFDLVFIFRDHALPPQHVDSIPMTYLEAVKDWLDSSGVLYLTSNINFNWTNVMKTINDDPVGFYEMGGWEVIQANPDAPDSSDEEDGDLDEDSVYDEESEDDEEEESDDSKVSEEEEEDDDDDDDESAYSDEGVDEEEAMDWDELEEKTKKEGKKQRIPSGRASFQPNKRPQPTMSSSTPAPMKKKR